jgi:formylglycine-generating enzyme required for sulfatase activity
MRTPTILLLVLGFAGCAKGIDPPAISEMVYFGGPSYTGPALEYTFGDDQGCPKPVCEEGATVGEVLPTIKAKVAPFALDATEVTNFQYEYCVRMGGCDDLTGYNLGVVISDYFMNAKYHDHPVVLVTARNAEQYCKFAGENSDPPSTKRLPTEVEWEYALRAAGQNTAGWPWGTSREGCLDKKVAADWCQPGQAKKGTAPVAASVDDVIAITGLPEGRNKLYDMMGNVSEWMANAPDSALTCLEDTPHCVDNFCEADCGGEGCSACRADGLCGACTGCTPACAADEDCVRVGDGVFECSKTQCSPKCTEGEEVCVAGNRCVPAACTGCTASQHCADFSYECGGVCEAACGDDTDCKSDCRRCAYCDPDKGGRDDCFRVCGDLAMCVMQPDTAFIPERYDYATSSTNMIRGGNWEVSPGNNPDNDRATQTGTCAMRNSARFIRKDGTDSAEWLGFRCAMDL